MSARQLPDIQETGRSAAADAGIMFAHLGDVIAT